MPNNKITLFCKLNAFPPIPENASTTKFRCFTFYAICLAIISRVTIFVQSISI